MTTADADDTYYITLPDNIPAAADVEAQRAKKDAEQAEQLRIERNLRYILAIPFEYCPWPAVRNELFQRILSGADIRTYAYYSCTEWKIEDNTYPDKPWLGSPRQWAVHNGYDVSEEVR